MSISINLFAYLLETFPQFVEQYNNAVMQLEELGFRFIEMPYRKEGCLLFTFGLGGSCTRQLGYDFNGGLMGVGNVRLD